MRFFTPGSIEAGAEHGGQREEGVPAEQARNRKLRTPERFLEWKISDSRIVAVLFAIRFKMLQVFIHSKADSA